MANVVYYVALGIDLNLTQPDLGHPALPDLWEQLHGKIKTGMLQCPECRERETGCPQWMYLRTIDGRREAVHLNPSIGAHADAPESDDHKALKERIFRAATAGGFEAVVEARAPHRKRVTDVLVHGDGIELGFEAQFSAITAPSVIRRSQVAQADGITPVWTTTDRTAAVIDRAPWVRIDRLPWHLYLDQTELPVRGGVRGLILEECSRRGLVCPDKKAGQRCRGWHGRWEPREVRRFDDLIVRAAGRIYVSVKQVTSKQSAFWFWALATDVGKVEPLEPGPEQAAGGAGDMTTRVALNPRPLDWACHYGEEGTHLPRVAPPRDAGTTIVENALLRRSVIVLDWNGPGHYAQVTAPCRICRKAASTRDDDGLPCHKVCAEDAMAAQGPLM